MSLNRCSKAITVKAVGIGIILFSVLTPGAQASSQISMACKSVNNWPVDYATVWHTAVKKHNAAPQTVSAASYMSGYIESQKMIFKVTDPKAIAVYRKYQTYWTLLEQDLIVGNGTMPQNAYSTKYLGPLMKNCAKYH